MSTDKLLNGLRIIDLSMGWAGPLAARNLADMGAQVIKVESCTHFDWWRSWEATPEWVADNGAEKALPYLSVNRNKLDITLDLESPTGRQLLLDLVAKADAVIENYAGSVLPKLKLDYPHLKAVNNELVMVSMPAFGSTGPWANYRAYGSTVEHSSGLPHLTGSSHQPPTMQHVALGDAIGGLNGTAALLSALWHKQKTGRGQFVDLSQVECLIPLGAEGVLHQSVHGSPPPRRGNDHPDFSPHGVYPCEGEDQWILIQISSEEQWLALQGVCAHLGRFGNNEERVTHRAELDKTLAQWTSNQHSTVLMQQLQSAGITAATLHNGLSLLEDEHLHARGYMQWLDRAFVGKQPHPSLPFRNGKKASPLNNPAPTLGQHNKQVLGGILGLDDTELEQLQLDGIIGNKPTLPI